MGTGKLQIARQAAKFAFDNLGGIALLRAMNRQRVRIIYYHRFETPQGDLAGAWRWHCEYLRRHYNPMSLSQVMDCWENGAPLPPNPVVVTVDDGFRDFYRVAFPVAREFQIPCLVYLVSGFIEERTWMWWSVIEHTLLKTAFETFTLAEGGPPLRFTSPQERMAAADLVCRWLKLQPRTRRKAFLETFPAEMKVRLPSAPEGYFEPLTWEEIREMSAAGMEFGAHSKTHPLMDELSQEEIDEETVESKAVIEGRIGRPVPHFCYPNGNFDKRCIQSVAAAGFRTATTCLVRWSEAGSSPFTLGRAPADLEMDRPRFLRQMAGRGWAAPDVAEREGFSKG